MLPLRRTYQDVKFVFHVYDFARKDFFVAERTRDIQSRQLAELLNEYGQVARNKLPTFIDRFYDAWIQATYVDIDLMCANCGKASGPKWTCMAQVRHQEPGRSASDDDKDDIFTMDLVSVPFCEVSGSCQTFSEELGRARLRIFEQLDLYLFPFLCLFELAFCILPPTQAQSFQVSQAPIIRFPTSRSSVGTFLLRLLRYTKRTQLKPWFASNTPSTATSNLSRGPLPRPSAPFVAKVLTIPCSLPRSRSRKMTRAARRKFLLWSRSFTSVPRLKTHVKRGPRRS